MNLKRLTVRIILFLKQAMGRAASARSVALAFGWMALAALSACVPNLSPLSMVSREGTLHHSLSPPALSGEFRDVVADVCDWAAQNQMAFDAELMRSIYFETTVGPSRYVPWYLLGAFLGSNEDRKQLVIALDPAVRPAPLSGHEDVFALIDRAGLWSVEKVDSARCAATSAGHAVARRGGVEHCVRAMRVEGPQTSISTAADYRILYYQLRGGGAPRRQVLQIRVLTLLADGETVGRAIWARFYADHGVLGGVNETCAPPPNSAPFAD